MPRNAKGYWGEDSIAVAAPSGRTIEIHPILGPHLPSNAFASQLINSILKILRITEDINECLLFFYDHGYWQLNESFGNNYRFFVVHGDRIIVDEFTLSRLTLDFFDASVLQPMHELKNEESGDESVEDDDEDEGALTQYPIALQLTFLYRRFYTETFAVHKKVLGGDLLYNYSPPERAEVERANRLRGVEWLAIGITLYLAMRFFFRWH